MLLHSYTVALEWVLLPVTRIKWKGLVHYIMLMKGASLEGEKLYEVVVIDAHVHCVHVHLLSLYCVII